MELVLGIIFLGTIVWLFLKVFDWSDKQDEERHMHWGDFAKKKKAEIASGKKQFYANEHNDFLKLKNKIEADYNREKSSWNPTRREAFEKQFQYWEEICICNIFRKNGTSNYRRIKVPSGQVWESYPWHAYGTKCQVEESKLYYIAGIREFTLLNYIKGDFGMYLKDFGDGEYEYWQKGKMEIAFDNRNLYDLNELEN